MMNFRLTPAVKYLLIANVAVFLLVNFVLRSEALTNFLSLFFIKSDYFLPHQFITYMFMHANDMHLLSNMLGLFIFGPLLEEFWGVKRFLAFFLICGIGSGVLYTGFKYYEIAGIDETREEYFSDPTASNLRYFVHNYGRDQEVNIVEFIDYYEEHPEDPAVKEKAAYVVNTIYQRNINSRMVGASGALFGILMAYALLFPNTIIFTFPVPIKAKYIVALLGIGAYYGAVKNAPEDNVAHVAHLSGMFIGFILVRYWQKSRKNFY